MNYLLAKGNVRVKVRFLSDTVEITRSVGGSTDTHKAIVTHPEGTRKVNELIREGYKAIAQPH